MFSPNELNSEYGRACRQRQVFWDRVGVPKKQRNKFAIWLGRSSATELWRENQDDFDIELLKECYEEYKEEKGMAGFDCKSTMLSVSDFNRAKEALVKASVPELHYSFTTVDGWQLLPSGNLIKEEETMDTTYEQRRYLETRLNSVNRDHEQALRSHFHMEPDFPATPREALDRIAKGTVKFPTAEKLEEAGYDLDGYFCGNIVWDFVDWSTTEADKDGFKAAEKLLGKAYTDAKDIIKVADPKDGLAALKEFESKSFH